MTYFFILMCLLSVSACTDRGQPQVLPLGATPLVLGGDMSDRLGTHPLGRLDCVIKCTCHQAQLFIWMLRPELRSFLELV